MRSLIQLSAFLVTIGLASTAVTSAHAPSIQTTSTPEAAEAGVEYRIGEPIQRHGLEVAAAYLVDVALEPDVPLVSNGGDVIHLEADVQATGENEHGFGEGDWVPYLTITYHVSKQDSGWSTSGTFLPMVAQDGPHYAANVPLDGPGDYHVVYRVEPPVYAGFFRHADAATGVPPWWEPFDVTWEFTYPAVPAEGEA